MAHKKQHYIDFNKPIIIIYSPLINKKEELDSRCDIDFQNIIL